MWHTPAAPQVISAHLLTIGLYTCCAADVVISIAAFDVVTAGAATNHVVARATINGVVTRPTHQQVVACQSIDRVFACTAKDRVVCDLHIVAKHLLSANDLSLLISDIARGRL